MSDLTTKKIAEINKSMRAAQLVNGTDSLGTWLANSVPTSGSALANATDASAGYKTIDLEDTDLTNVMGQAFRSGSGAGADLGLTIDAGVITWASGSGAGAYTLTNGDALKYIAF